MRKAPSETFPLSCRQLEHTATKRLDAPSPHTFNSRLDSTWLEWKFLIPAVICPIKQLPKHLKARLA